MHHLTVESVRPYDFKQTVYRQFAIKYYRFIDSLVTRLVIAVLQHQYARTAESLALADPRWEDPSRKNERFSALRCISTEEHAANDN